MPEISKEDILLFIYDNQPVSFSELELRFVQLTNIARISRGTLAYRLRELKESGYIERIIDNKIGKPRWIITEKETSNVQKIKEEKEWLYYYRKSRNKNEPFVIMGVAYVKPIQVQQISPDNSLIINAMSDIPNTESEETHYRKIDGVLQCIMYEYNNRKEFYHLLNKINNDFFISIAWKPYQG